MVKYKNTRKRHKRGRKRHKKVRKRHTKVRERKSARERHKLKMTGKYKKEQPKNQRRAGKHK